MIISTNPDPTICEFEELLSVANDLITRDSKKRPDYYLSQSPTDFEEVIKTMLDKASEGTKFERSIELVSGHKFPDIIAKKYFGVEVKTTKKNHWKSTGNSVLETTRIDDINRIYLFFAQLKKPIKFRFRLYQDCLSEVAVTHSPRYLIDMELKDGETIFDKIGFSYDEIRVLEDPIRPIVDYYKKIAKPGEEPWWMESNESPEIVINPMVSLWGNLPSSKKKTVRNLAFARYPELFGNSRTKYQKLATWLAGTVGVVSPSLRDSFTAGGKVNISVNGRTYKRLPKIFLHLRESADEILENVRNLDPYDIAKLWDLTYIPDQRQIVQEWINQIIYYSSLSLSDSQGFIYDLLGISLKKEEMPHSVKEFLATYSPKP